MDVLAFQQAGDAGFADRQRAENQRPVRDRFVARHADTAGQRAAAAGGQAGLRQRRFMAKSRKARRPSSTARRRHPERRDFRAFRRVPAIDSPPATRQVKHRIFRTSCKEPIAWLNPILAPSASAPVAGRSSTISTSTPIVCPKCETAIRAGRGRAAHAAGCAQAGAGRREPSCRKPPTPNSSRWKMPRPRTQGGKKTAAAGAEGEEDDGGARRCRLHRGAGGSRQRRRFRHHRRRRRRKKRLTPPPA